MIGDPSDIRGEESSPVDKRTAGATPVVHHRPQARTVPATAVPILEQLAAEKPQDSGVTRLLERVYPAVDDGVAPGVEEPAPPRTASSAGMAGRVLRAGERRP